MAEIQNILKQYGEWGIRLKNNKFIKNTLIKFAFQEIICLAIVVLILISIFGITRLSNFQWLYDYSPDLYFKLIEMFNSIYNGIGLFIIITITWLTLTFILLHKIIKQLYTYIKEVTDASKLLFDKDTEYIKLPSELEMAEENLNQLKREYEKSKRISKENEQKKDDLIVYLAHDIKTPLTSMIGYLSLLDEIDDMPKKQRQKYISIALEKSYKLEDLINELFDITRFNSEKIVLMKEEVNVKMMLEQIADDFYPLLKENDRNIKITSSSKVVINADSKQLARVFSNIIKNACFYSTDKEILIDIKTSSDTAHITISNKGKKIPEEKLKLLFEKFYRADSSRTSKTGGSGLGLAIAKEITKLHGGDIFAESDNDYTRFHIKLPIK